MLLDEQVVKEGKLIKKIVSLEKAVPIVTIPSEFDIFKAGNEASRAAAAKQLGYDPNLPLLFYFNGHNFSDIADPEAFQDLDELILGMRAREYDPLQNRFKISACRAFQVLRNTRVVEIGSISQHYREISSIETNQYNLGYMLSTFPPKADGSELIEVGTTLTEQYTALVAQKAGSILKLPLI